MQTGEQLDTRMMVIVVDLVRYIDEYEDRYHRQHTTPTGNPALRESGTSDGMRRNLLTEHAGNTVRVTGPLLPPMLDFGVV